MTENTLPPISDAMTSADINAYRMSFNAQAGRNCSFLFIFRDADGAASPHIGVSFYGAGAVLGQSIGWFASWPDAIHACSKFVADRDVARTEREIRRMALEIINMTHKGGEQLTKAVLLSQGFTPNDVDDFSDQAITLANAMANAGPFTIGGMDG